MAKTTKSFEEINERIRSGKAVVLTANEMSDLVDEVGPAKAAKEVDVVTTGTFGMMCSSGAMFNFGHTTPKIKSANVWINDVPAYAGMAAVDTYLGVTEPIQNRHLVGLQGPSVTPASMASWTLLVDDPRRCHGPRGVRNSTGEKA